MMKNDVIYSVNGPVITVRNTDSFSMMEMVQVGGGLAVLAFLAHGTAMRTNIFVDSFTTRLPARVNDAIDAFINTLEAKIVASPNKFDDWALPIIAKVREIRSAAK